MISPLINTGCHTKCNVLTYIWTLNTICNTTFSINLLSNSLYLASICPSLENLYENKEPSYSILSYHLISILDYADIFMK